MLRMEVKNTRVPFLTADGGITSRHLHLLFALQQSRGNSCSLKQEITLYGERQTRGTRPEKLNADDVVEQRFDVSRWDRSLGRDTTRRGKGQEKKRKINPFYL